MQLQFEKQGLSCLQTVKREVQHQEQTQEIRVSDGMPDIGRIIGVWGQVIVRSKEWQSDGMAVSGGTMVWVQYVPEEGGQPQSVESWIPFQMKWSFPQTRHDGTIMTQSILRSVDARSTSARKLMLRTNVAVLAWAMEPQTMDVFIPKEVPEDIELLRRRYPVLLPTEAGEKAFSLEEPLSLPPSAPPMEQPIYYTLQPEITEEKIMKDKVIFRGISRLHMLYQAEDGGQYSWDFDLPFTQYGELDKEYPEEAEVMIWPCVTALELDKDQDQLSMKAGLVCQYQICDRPLVEVVEDAYSPRRSVTPARSDLELPGILERESRNIHAQLTTPMDGMRLTDVQFHPQPVVTQSVGSEGVMEIPGIFQMLYYDMDGQLHTSTQKWEQTEKLPLGDDCVLDANSWPIGTAQGNLLAGNAQMSGELNLQIQTSNGGAIPMVTGLEIGEMKAEDPQRPSLILRCPGRLSMWELAKETGSTVAAIRQTNKLQQEPDEDQMLLIPVV